MLQRQADSLENKHLSDTPRVHAEKTATCADKLDVESVFAQRVARRAAEDGVIPGGAHVHHSHRAGVDGALPPRLLLVPAARPRHPRQKAESDCPTGCNQSAGFTHQSSIKRRFA